VCGPAAAQGLAGDWIGGFKQNKDWLLIRVHFDDRDVGRSVAFFNANRQDNGPGAPLTEVRATDSTVHFRLAAPGREVTFEGKVRADSISGTARGEQDKVAWTGPFQLTRVRFPDEKALREYSGTYQLGPDQFLYLQIWNELSGVDQLVAVDESGEVRVLYSTDRDRFFTGPGAAFPIAVESSVRFERQGNGAITSLTWQRGSKPPRTAQRVTIEKRQEVRFRNGDIQLSGTLVSPNTDGKHPAIILVHGSGPQGRASLFPFVASLVRRGIAVLGYDKRGVGGSTGNWQESSFEDLAGDVVAAFDYLKTRSDVDPRQIGLFGVSQAGWIMPLAAVRARDVAFLISVSGAAIPAAQTELDHMQSEMRMAGEPESLVGEVTGLIQLMYAYMQTGDKWQEYLAARQKLAARGPVSVPATRDDPYWAYMRKILFYDPAPTVAKLRCPTLAIFGELDNNVLPKKNKAAWETALKSGGHPDYTLVILPRADHIMLQATVGSSAEMSTLQRFVPEYSTTIRNWLATRIRGFGKQR
jgi:pimeloyl-ACP methyl ester carboxylesterase